jgi:hypothetical protein
MKCCVEEPFGSTTASTRAAKLPEGASSFSISMMYITTGKACVSLTLHLLQVLPF